MNKRLQFLWMTVLALVAGCSEPPERAKLQMLLASEAALPKECSGLIRVYREDVGDIQTDYSNIYQVAADEGCQTAWLNELATSGDWQCNNAVGVCERSLDSASTDDSGGRYREELGTVRFLTGLVQVELQKI